MRNLSSAPALLAAALATTTLEGCSAINPVDWGKAAYDWFEGDDSTADKAIHHAKTDNPTYPGDFSVAGELEKARAAALKHSEVSTFVDVPKWKVWSDNDHTDVSVDTSKFADQCFEPEGTVDLNPSPEVALNPSAEVDPTPERRAALDKKNTQVSRLARFKSVQDLAATALKSNTFTTLWPAYQKYQTELGSIPSTLADEVTNLSQDNVLCPDQKAYLLDGGKQVPVVAFEADDKRLALPPDFWSGALNDCERAGVLAAIQYDGGREFATYPETSGKGTDTTNLLQATVTGRCESPQATVAGAGRYLESYYGWAADRYKLSPDGKLYVDGSTEINGHDVIGNFYLQPGESKDCPSAREIQTITLGEKSSLELHFKDCAPDDSLAATLVEGDKRFELTPDPTESDNHNWGFCLKENETECLKWTEYTLDADTYAWTNTIEKKQN
jgi:hypothetical protein